MDFRDRTGPAPSGIGYASSQRFFTPTEAHRLLGVYCVGVGWQDGATAPIPNRLLDSYAAVLVHSGRGTLAVGRSAPQPVVGPALFWLFPGVSHSYAPARGGWSESWVLFDGFGVRGYEALRYLDRGRPLLSLSDAAALEDVFGRLIRRCTEVDAGVEVDASVLIQELVAATAAAAHPEAVRDEATRLVAGLRAGAATAMTVTDHARRLGVSVRVLRAAVRRGAGSTPKEVILHERIGRAKSLLADTDFLVAQVAREVGYDDPAFFSRIFAQQVGSPPVEFRRAVSRSAGGESG